MRGILIGVLISGLAGCAELPEIEDGITAADEAAEYPDLIRLSPATIEQAQEEDETSATLQARAAGLRSRARDLSAPVLTDPERARLENAGS